MKVQNLKPEACYKMVVTDEASARQCLRELVRYLGMGFHMDEPAEAYTTNSNERTFEKFECEFYDSNLNSICEILGDEVPKIVMSVWCELGMLTDKELQKQEEAMTGERLDYPAELEKLIKLLDGFIGEKLDEDTTGRFCAVLTKDITCGDSASIRFLEEDGSTLVMDMLQELADYLLRTSGRHFCISNNSPTDGHALVFLDPEMDEEFNKHRFADEFKAGFDIWLKDPESFNNRRHQQLAYQTLDDYIDRTCDGTTNWKDHLKYNEEMLYQVVYWNRYDYPTK